MTMAEEHLFKTNRLGFRLLTEEDIQFFRKLDDETFALEQKTNNDQALDRFAARISDFIDEYRKGGLPCFTIIELNSHDLVGSCGFSPVASGDVEVRYVFHKKYWGKGFATETLVSLLRWAQDNLENEYIIGYTIAEHTASCHVMEKSGMTYYKTDVADGVECRFYRFKNK